MADTRWMLLREINTFRPDHYRMVICQRDLTQDVLEGQKERRQEFSIDMYSGRSWGRQGSGRYLRWSTIPPVGMMRSPSKERPRPDKSVIISCKIPMYFGPKIGRIHADSSDLYWQLLSDQSNDWVAIPSSYIEGWLDLP